MIVYDSGPAFPVSQDTNANCTGLSVRDYFAGQALIGFAANRDYIEMSIPDLVHDCYRFADYMLKERRKDGGE